jgi:hypothetical protein
MGQEGSWTEFFWPRVVNIGGLCESVNEPSDCIKFWESFDWFLASKKKKKKKKN